MLQFSDTRGLVLADTLCCGQCFRWQPVPGGWQGIVAGRAVLASQQPGGALEITGLAGYAPETEPAFWERYFALDLDYPALQARFAAAHPGLAMCVAAAPGIRVLRQPFFETLLTFLISQNNNIPRIQGIVARLCSRFGTPLGGELYAFPTPEQLAGRSAAELDCLRAGWRAAWLAEAAGQAAAGQLSEAALARLSTARARDALMQLRGVGPKVADCTLLYGLGRWDAYPVDVWIRRADEALFPARIRDVGRYLNRRTGGHAGIAQQYIFAWARRNLPAGSGGGAHDLQKSRPTD